MPEVFAGRRGVMRVTMAQATLNTGQTLFGVNDIFIGPRTHTSALYTIACGGRSERQSSSGVIVSTGVGSSGWFRSIVTGATGIAAALAGKGRKTRDAEGFAWDANYLCYSVREPWPSKTSAASMTFGRITAGRPLELISHMPENGVIFSDGIEHDYLEFNAGARLKVSVAEKQGHLVQ